MSEPIAPRQWSIFKVIEPDTSETIYKVLAGWGADAWKINSGIKKIEETERMFLYHGYSGSVYHCHKSCYGTGTMSQSIYDDYAKKMVEAGYEPLVMLSEAEAFALKL